MRSNQYSPPFLPVVINKKNGFTAERFRAIKTNLQFIKAESGAPLQSLVFTSAHKGEGKSFCALNLAVTYARQNVRVLLVDADLYKPKLTGQFQMKYAEGLSNVLANYADPMALVQGTSEANLMFLPSGVVPPNPLELINSYRMKEVLETYKEAFDLVLFDTPPVLLLNDGRILGSLCDGVILAVRSNVTKEKDVVQAMDLINRADGRVVGSVLNGKKYGAREMKTYSYY
ncbi:capsular polysaccharide biosynthesis protein [Listeria grandensis FSL F6-0971]|uniref:non-specific protein-tyrosine kinase n=1 Tax=Listeria grandensis FSL F6-0971 TaxID=1265819 RepID=W7BEA3_9LIST|nr:CpsD/CapB family tyrosine-protein kinase [Listeria grandensis]EUJ23145.1 capsular polysaccharide biosynthesis protein [Listeria grandensis FSL F6-0971]